MWQSYGHPCDAQQLLQRPAGAEVPACTLTAPFAGACSGWRAAPQTDLYGDLRNRQDDAGGGSSSSTSRGGSSSGGSSGSGGSISSSQTAVDEGFSALECAERLPRRARRGCGLGGGGGSDDDDEDDRPSRDHLMSACGGGRAAAATAAALGPGSAPARLLCARVSVYTDASSPAALAAANGVMARIRLPGGVPYEPVTLGSAEFQMGVMWHFPAFAVTLGASNFRRLLAATPHLARAARRCPAFAGVCMSLPADTAAPSQLPPLSEEELFVTSASLRSTQFTCIFLATKVADQVHASGLLRFMLNAITGQRERRGLQGAASAMRLHSLGSCGQGARVVAGPGVTGAPWPAARQPGAAVSSEMASEVELRCLEGLNWRLGPYFSEDPMGGDDADLAALLGGHGTA
ncbi:hypothetical protein MNEG_10699 [Monoraphidium neglectum]|uniref:Uncharacterized protein n=1 Tax=Monoraphidium neglectum TaxID=145388 RepID=A0A0D2KNP8_9CHLO|nr:hypothetical protein MNEG_10699 [Monoraphidium neglectum]KIY97263.1 hypothetical protein MNEG_10699 [Monoraphidium neglectum]|eukprot:XP_013896283.1 hypothetical protein MNEG_10699 [Monoraphidium neglectum]